MKKERKFRNFKDYHIEELGKSKEDCALYLKIALEEYLEDGDKEAFYQALQDVVEARGGATNIAKSSDVSRQNLYKIFSAKTNPRIETIASILNSLGLTLTVESLN